MSIKNPPRFVVQHQDALRAQRRRRWWLWSGWVASVLLAFGLGWLVAGRLPAAPEDTVDPALSARNQALQRQVVNLTQALQVSKVATRTLKDTLSQREEKINGLRADLTFYSHLIGGGAQHHGLRVQDVHLDRVGDSRAWNVGITLTHNVRRGAKVTGDLTVQVEGILDGKLTRLDWDRLSAPADRDGLNFDFRYFQQVHGTLMLPAHFIPNRLRIVANPNKGKAVVRTLDWSTALKSLEDNDVQQ